MSTVGERLVQVKTQSRRSLGQQHTKSKKIFASFAHFITSEKKLYVDKLTSFISKT